MWGGGGGRLGGPTIGPMAAGPTGMGPMDAVEEEGSIVPSCDVWGETDRGIPWAVLNKPACISPALPDMGGIA